MKTINYAQGEPLIAASMSLRQTATLYLEGRKLRAQARELSQVKLAAKFERSTVTISKIAKGMPVNIPEWEKKLIRDCLNERTRLQWEASKLSMPRLCSQHKLTHQTLEDELVLMGEREVSA